MQVMMDRQLAKQLVKLQTQEEQMVTLKAQVSSALMHVSCMQLRLKTRTNCQYGCAYLE